MARFRRSWVASASVLTALAILVASPLAAGTTFSYPYNATFTTNGSTTSGTGVTTFGPSPLSPTASAGTTVFWQNSSVGQLGPSVAKLELNQSFESPMAYPLSAGTHFFNVTWRYTGEYAFFSRCFASNGIAELYANQSFEIQLSKTVGHTTTWVPTSPVSVSDWSHSYGSMCPSTTQSITPLTSVTSTKMLSLSVPSGTGSYYIWASLYTDTTALEPNVTDIIASACINYELGNGGCAPASGSGSALLVQVSFT